jgi:hypothetical protein
MNAIACGFGYYLINFYVKYLPGDIYTNQIVNSISEAFGNASAAYIATKMPIHWGFALSFLACGIACVFVIFAEIHEALWMIPLGILVAKFSISCGFSTLYFATVHYFETSYLGFMMGLTNFFGRFSTIFAPMVAE